MRPASSLDSRAEQGFARAPVALESKQNVVLDGMHVEHGRLLEFAADAEQRDFGLVEAYQIVGAVEIDLPAVGAGLAGHDVHHGGLAGAIWTDDGAHLTRLYGERQVVQRPKAVEGYIHAIEIKQRRRGARDHSAHSTDRAAAASGISLAPGPAATSARRCRHSSRQA